MFHSARVKLTAVYLTIIMLISISFSLVIYQVLTNELDRVASIQRERIQYWLPGNNFGNPFPLDADLVKETKNRIIVSLGIINAIILLSSAALGYFLAGRTLKPISDMVEGQKEFISNASHELRTPLTSLKTEIEVSLRDKNMDLKEAKNLLSSNLEEVDKMQKLSNYLLEINRLNSQTDLEFASLDLKDISQDAIEKVKGLAKAKGIKIESELKAVKAKGNKEALTELATILLDNAIKFSGKSKRIIIKTYKSPTNSILEVKDFGIGIPEKDLPHIFDRFYRADISRSKEKVDGYGLGLSIAKGIVELHKGQINVKSTLGKGSTFTVKI